jgi:hypothetical protein
MHHYVANGEQTHLHQRNKLKIYNITLIANKSTREQRSGTIDFDGCSKNVPGEE